MKNTIALLALGFLSFNASATTVCGELEIQKVMCMRAPCPPLTSLTPKSGKAFAVLAKEGSAAKAFLKNLTEGTRTVCIEGQIERESILVATTIRLKH